VTNIGISEENILKLVILHGILAVFGGTMCHLVEAGVKPTLKTNKLLFSGGRTGKQFFIANYLHSPLILQLSSTRPQ
jgi:hypothetical protein